MSLKNLKLALNSERDFSNYYHDHSFEVIYHDIMAFRHEANDLFEMTKAVASGTDFMDKVGANSAIAERLISVAKEIVKQLNEE